MAVTVIESNNKLIRFTEGDKPRVTWMRALRPIIRLRGRWRRHEYPIVIACRGPVTGIAGFESWTDREGGSIRFSLNWTLIFHCFQQNR